MASLTTGFRFGSPPPSPLWGLCHVWVREGLLEGEESEGVSKEERGSWERLCRR